MLTSRGYIMFLSQRLSRAWWQGGSTSKPFCSEMAQLHLWPENKAHRSTCSSPTSTLSRGHCRCWVWKVLSKIYGKCLREWPVNTCGLAFPGSECLLKASTRQGALGFLVYNDYHISWCSMKGTKGSKRPGKAAEPWLWQNPEGWTGSYQTGGSLGQGPPTYAGIVCAKLPLAQTLGSFAVK